MNYSVKQGVLGPPGPAGPAGNPGPPVCIFCFGMMKCGCNLCEFYFGVKAVL